MQKQRLVSKSVKDTQKLAAEIINNLNGINLICLYGDLGTGKTTFVQGLAKALGVKQRIISPTFIIIREYSILNSLFVIHYSSLIHIDCYRINSSKDLKSINLEEYWKDNKNLVVVEWAERISSILPKKRIDIRFEYKDEDSRIIKIITNN